MFFARKTEKEIQKVSVVEEISIRETMEAPMGNYINIGK